MVFLFFFFFLIRATMASQASYNGKSNGSSSDKIEIVDKMQLKVNEMCLKMDELQHELELKNGAVYRKF